MVDREPQLVAVLAELPLAALGQPRADAGVVDQDVELRRRALDVARQVPHLLERGEVGQECGRGHAAAAQLARDGVELRAVAPVDEHARAAGEQLASHGAPEPVGGAGDEHDGVLDRSHCTPEVY